MDDKEKGKEKGEWKRAIKQENEEERERENKQDHLAIRQTHTIHYTIPIIIIYHHETASPKTKYETQYFMFSKYIPASVRAPVSLGMFETFEANAVRRFAFAPCTELSRAYILDIY